MFLRPPEFGQFFQTYKLMIMKKLIYVCVSSMS
jgi:hypothetical protein